MMKDWLKCPQMSYNQHVLRIAQPGVAPPLELGALFHESIAERIAHGTPANESMDGFASEAVAGLWAKHRLWVPINRFEVPPEWELLGVEQAYEAGFNDDGDILEGRLDLPIFHNGKYWSVQWKTYEGDILELCEQVRTSFHEVAYQWLCQCNGMTPWGGTILGACEKLPGYWMLPGHNGKKRRVDITDEDRAQAFTLHYLTRSEEVQASMWADIQLHLDRMCYDWKTRFGSDGRKPRNYDQCRSFGRRCQYYGVCHGLGDVADEMASGNGTWVQLPSRY